MVASCALVVQHLSIGSPQPRKSYSRYTLYEKGRDSHGLNYKQRYNPELQKRSLENREKKQQDFASFITKLKEYSKSDKPIWEAAAEDEARTKLNAAEKQSKIAADIQKRRDEIKRHSIGQE